MRSNKTLISLIFFVAVTSTLIVVVSAINESFVYIESEEGRLEGLSKRDDPDSSDGFIEFKEVITGGSCSDSLGSKMASRGIVFGAAVDTNSLKNSTYKDTLKCNFRGVVAENEMKWDPVQKVEGEFNFAAADQIVDLAEANGMLVRGHVLVWHNVNQAGFVQNLPCDRMLDAMEAHITTVMKRYKGRVQHWDVVNEAVADGESGKLRTGRTDTGSFWHACLGDGYIEKAFQFARAADPDAKLYYNDYAIYNATWPKHKKVREIVADLKTKGLIDGVGMQSHIQPEKYPFETASYKKAVQSFADLGVDVAITEIDVEVTGNNPNLNLQADVYRGALEGCLAVSACKTFFTWGVSDNRTWLPNGLPLLFDKQYDPKPAVGAMLGLF